MRRFLLLTVLCLTAPVLAQDGSIQKAKIRKVDADKGVITLVVGDKDLELQASDQTKFLNVPGQNLKERLSFKGLAEGTAVQFIGARKDGQTMLMALRIADSNSPAARVKVDTSKLKPLTEMGKELYQGYPGGLYPDGQNQRPAAHETVGLALAKQIQPLNAEGKPDPQGKIVLLGIGMSNTTQVYSAFKQQADADKEKNPQVTIVDGAQGGMTAARIQDADDQGSGTKFWSTVDQRLKASGVTREQVQAAWIKQADAGPSQGFPRYAKTLQEELAKIVQLMHTRFPNLKQVYLSGRTYGGYATTGLNPEPYAFESGLSVKWLIEQQLKGEPELNHEVSKGPVRAAWLSWGPYLWANGTTKRADGFWYAESDFVQDGTHHSQAGRQKVGEHILQFFKADTTTRPWFVKR